jgi:glycine cleavage system aminomethyltransferase T
MLNIIITMPISHMHKYIYVHIPKTAGTSIGHQMNNAPNSDKWEELLIVGYSDHKKKHLQHFNYLDIVSHCKDNSIDRAVSDFYFCNDFFNNIPIRYRDVSILKNKFVTFLEEFLTTTINKYDDHQIPQYTYLLDDSGTIADCIKVLRFENISEDYLSLGIGKLDLHMNATAKRYSYEKYYNKTSYDMICQYYEQDFIRFGYSFDLKY